MNICSVVRRVYEALQLTVHLFHFLVSHRTYNRCMSRRSICVTFFLFIIHIPVFYIYYVVRFVALNIEWYSVEKSPLAHTMTAILWSVRYDASLLFKVFFPFYLIHIFLSLLCLTAFFLALVRLSFSWSHGIAFKWIECISRQWKQSRCPATLAQISEVTFY